MPVCTPLLFLTFIGHKKPKKIPGPEWIDFGQSDKEKTLQGVLLTETRPECVSVCLVGYLWTLLEPDACQPS